MEKFANIYAIAALLSRTNIDTDMIIPQKFLKTVKRSGLGRHVFTNIRYFEDGSEREDFVLNKPTYRNARILVVGENFGCGSSREHAVWALKNFGIACIIATGFADIFYNNCFRNGLLPIILSQDIIKKITNVIEQNLGAIFTIDLEKQEITDPNEDIVKFEIEPFRKHFLLQGLDEISLTLKKHDSLTAFEADQVRTQPWLYHEPEESREIMKMKWL